jgi:hypothetical protein
MTVTATWSCGKTKKHETLKLTGKDTWTIELPQEVTKLTNGDADDVMIDLTDGTRRSLYVVDLCRTRVMHFVDGKINGTLKSDTDRPEGKTVANWQLSLVDNGLLIDMDVFDSEIRTDADWAWGRDNMTLLLDYRPTERFADPGIDSEVHQVILAPDEKPTFSVTMIPWLGRGMARAAAFGGEKTPTGYKLHMFISKNFSKTMSADATKRDFIGINISNVDLDARPDGRKDTIFTRMQPTQYASDQYANNLPILDLNNKIAGDSVTNVSMTKL